MILDVEPEDDEDEEEDEEDEDENESGRRPTAQACDTAQNGGTIAGWPATYLSSNHQQRCSTASSTSDSSARA